MKSGPLPISLAKYRQLRLLTSLVICLSFLVACDANPTTTPPPLASSPQSSNPGSPTLNVKGTPAPETAAFPVPLNSRLAAMPPFDLTVWFADDYYNKPPLVNLFKEFHAAYPNITIKVEAAEWNAMRDKVKNAVREGNPPDLAHQHAFAFGAQGYAEKLDDLWRQEGSNFSDRFTAGALEDVTWQANYYGVPLDINAECLIYNKQMFKAAGLAEPDANYTYPKLLEDAKKLTAPDSSRYGVAISNATWNMYGLVRSAGGRILEQLGSSLPLVRLADSSNLEMLQYAANLINKYKVSPMPPATGRYEPVSLFEQRKIAMFFSGPWDLTEIEQNGAPGLFGEVGTTTMPRGFNGATKGSVQGGGSMFVPKGAKHREAAFELMKWAVSPKYQMRLAREMGRYPVLDNLYSDPFFGGQTLLKPYFAMLQNSHPYDLEAYAEGDAVWDVAIKAILNQGQDVTVTLQNASQLIDRIIKK